MQTNYDLIIIGAGNLGLWTAFHLAREKFGRIAVLERNWAGSGTTTRSAGIVRQQGGSVTAIKLGQWSRELYPALGEELGLDSGFVEAGYYVLADSREQENAFQELVALRQSCGLENEWLDAAEGKRRFTALNWEMFRGATYTASDGYVIPQIVARNITYAVSREPQVKLVEQCPVLDITQAGNVFQVRTPLGIFEAERILNAGGARGSRALGEMVGVDVPVLAARHTVVTFPLTGPLVTGKFPMFFMLSEGMYWRPEEQGILLGFSNPEETIDTSEGYQIDFDREYMDKMRPIWERAFPTLKGQEISRGWSASIDFTPDHLPIIDEPQRGVYVLAAGGHGMMWGPGLGKKMAELILHGEIADLPADEIAMERFKTPHPTKDKIALPFPTNQAT
jgi:sarcosine oxidase subunit beta